MYIQWINDGSILEVLEFNDCQETPIWKSYRTSRIVYCWCFNCSAHWRLETASWFNDWSLWMQDANGSLSSEKKIKVVFVLGEQKCINILSRVLSQLIICVSESNFRWMLRQQAKINHPNKFQEKEKQLLVIDKKEPNVSIFLIDSFGGHS